MTEPGGDWALRVLAILMILFGFSCVVVAADGAVGHGTVVSTRNDIVRFGVQGGLGNPSPAISADAYALMTKYPVDALGLGMGFSRHELVEDNAGFSDQHLDLLWEHSWPILSGYYAFRTRGGLGIARAHRAMDKNVASLLNDDPSRIYWGAHVCASFSTDVPLADLVWARFGFNVQKILLERTPTQSSVVGGIVWGGQWFGIGD